MALRLRANGRAPIRTWGAFRGRNAREERRLGCSVTLLIFLAAPARAWIVAPDLLPHGHLLRPAVPIAADHLEVLELPLLLALDIVREVLYVALAALAL